MNGRFDIETPLYDTGCDGVALSDFRLLVEGGRYPDGGADFSLHRRLAAFVAGRGGERRDRPIYELCHFVVALAARGMASEGERIRLLLGLDPVTARTVREAVDGELAHGDGDARFVTHARRAPFLFAVHEFLAQMEGCLYYGELNDVFERMLADGGGEAAIREASNAIARRLAQYRRAHFDWAANAQAFTALSQFLGARKGEARWRIDDDAVYEFWRERSTSGRFREYRTSFDAFTRLMRVLDRTTRMREAERALPLGPDRDAGEIDLAAADEDDDGDWEEAEWQDPLACFADEDLRRINFFKTASEHKPLEALMRYGPFALRLTHAFMRLECFAPIQSAIGNDLRVGRGAASLASRLDLAAAPTYGEKKRQFEDLLDHVRDLMQAMLHIVGSDDLPADITAAAEQAFKAIRRKGFDETGDGEAERGAAFRTAADKLPAIADHLLGFLNQLDQFGDQSFLDQQFETDKRLFGDQFRLLYGKST